LDDQIQGRCGCVQLKYRHVYMIKSLLSHHDDCPYGECYDNQYPSASKDGLGLGLGLRVRGYGLVLKVGASDVMLMLPLKSHLIRQGLGLELESNLG